MASYFTLTLDTTAPSGTSIKVPSLVNTRSVTATLAATGATQMKLWGDIVAGTSSSTAITEAAASWEAYATTRAVTLTSGDKAKTVYAKFRDAVGNESAAVSATVTLDMTAPAVTVSAGPDHATVSTVSGYEKSAFSWSADGDFVEYKVCVVPANTSVQSAGTVIGTTNGSENMAATGTFKAAQTVASTITGADLKAASSADGAKIIKIFVRDAAGNWSV